MVEDNRATTEIIARFNKQGTQNAAEQQIWSELREQYRDQLEEYTNWGSRDLYDYVAPNTGWKIHLNVTPNNVKQVSQFLSEGGFTHKFLSEASIEGGKIFTVYFGRKQVAQRGIKIVSESIGDLLSEPRSKGEQLVAPNIIARFDIKHPLYFDNSHAYRNGIPFMRYYDEEDPLGSEQKSKEFLLKEYGEYFGSGLEVCDPKGELHQSKPVQPGSSTDHQTLDGTPNDSDDARPSMDEIQSGESFEHFLKRIGDQSTSKSSDDENFADYFRRLVDDGLNLKK